MADYEFYMRGYDLTMINTFALNLRIVLQLAWNSSDMTNMDI